MKVLVTFAVDAEFAPWRKLRKFRKSNAESSGRLRFAATVEGLNVEVQLTGIGRKACETAVSEFDFSGESRPDLVISSGLAGALREDFNPGDTIVPLRIRTLNNDADSVVDAMLVDKAVQSGAIPIPTLITAQRIVQTAEEKRRLAFFGEAVDMESAYVMSSCAKAGIACLTIRTISDAANEDLPIDFDRCLTPQGTVRPMKLINTIVEGPSRLPRLIRFGRQSSQAVLKLIIFLDGFVAALAQIEAATK
jgi:nucleoside phosphorylase